MKNVQLEERIRGVQIIEKLKRVKSTQYFRKFLKYSVLYETALDHLGFDSVQLTGLIIVLSGSVEVAMNTTSNQQCQTTKKRIKSGCYQVINDSFSSINLFPNSCILHLAEKYLYDIFEGILSFSHLNSRLRQLRKSEFFSNMKRSLLIRIVFTLKELSYGIQTKIYQEKQLHPYFYYIAEGEVKLMKGKVSVSILTQGDVFGNFKHPEFMMTETVKVISERIKLYQIKCNALFDQSQSSSLSDKRAQWREERISKNKEINSSQSNKKTVFCSFLQKEMIFSSFYQRKKEDIKKLAQTCSHKEKRSASREEFYAKKLDRLRELQKKKWGDIDKQIVLYEFSKTRTIFPNRSRMKTEPSKTASFFK